MDVRAFVTKFCLERCKMKISKFPKLSQNVLLMEVFLKKYFEFNQIFWRNVDRDALRPLKSAFKGHT